MPLFIGQLAASASKTAATIRLPHCSKPPPSEPDYRKVKPPLPSGAGSGMDEQPPKDRDEWVDWARAKQARQEAEKNKGKGNGADPAHDAPSPPPNRPIVRVVNGKLPRAIDAAEQIFAKNDPEIFEFAGHPVYLGREAPPRNQIVMYRRRIMQRYDTAHLADQWTRFVDFQKYDGRNNQWRSIDCPEKFATIYLQRKGRRHLRPLRAVISTPTLRLDGSILERPGYDEETALFYDPCGLLYPAVPVKPSRDDALAALARLKEPIALFPYVSDASRSVTLSAELTGLIRPSLPTAPVHSSSATVAGSGKSMLDNIVAMILTGRTVHAVAETANTEEFEKRLATALIKGSQIIGLDNCTVPIGGGLFCQAATEQVVSIREFGVLKDVEVDNTALILVNGNNLVFLGDIFRRVLRAALDPKCERPETREFDFCPVKMAAERRAELVISGLTILRAFHVVDRPKQGALKPLGSFDDWSEWVRAALVWLGEPDPCLTMAAARDTDPELRRLRSLLGSWRDLFPVGAATIKRVAEEARQYTKDDPDLATKRTALLEAIEAIALDRHDLNFRTLGNWIARHKGRVVDGLCFEEDGVSHHATLWKVTRPSQKEN
jgi:hypothetical protein